MIQKPLVVGLPSPNQCSLEQFKKICSKYQDKIAYIYVHPPFGGIYNCRNELNCARTKENLIYFQEGLNIAKQYNFKIQAAFNQGAIRTIYTKEQLLKDIETYQILFGIPDEIITYDKFAESIKLKYPNIKLVRTFNEAHIQSTSPLNLYNLVVVGDNNSFNLNLFKNIKQQYLDLKIEFLINQCHPACNKSGCDKCENLFAKYMETHSVDEFIANTVIFQEEIDILNNYIDYYKFATRRDIWETWEYYYDSDYKRANLNILNWHNHILQGKYKWFKNEIKWNLDNILEYKQKLWQSKGYQINISI